MRDGLTGLFNRRYLEETLDREVNRTRRSGRSFSLIISDIDHFKKFNDTHGHEAGDAVLKAVASLLQAKLRVADIACRFGGEEFVLILPEAFLADALLKAESLRAAVQALLLQYAGKDLGPVTLSLGVACFPEHGPNAEVIMRSADDALYRAKHAGRNRVEPGTAPAHAASPD